MNNIALNLNDTVGFIGNFFTELFLKRDFKPVKIDPSYLFEFIEDHNLTTAFIDIDYYLETAWSSINVNDTIDYLNKNGVYVYIIAHDPEKINDYENVIFINHNYDFQSSQNKSTSVIELPYLVSEFTVNPIDSTKKISMLALVTNVFDEDQVISPMISRVLKLNKTSYEPFQLEDYEDKTIKSLIQLIKKSKVLYINDPASFNFVTLNYLKVISHIVGTKVIINDQSPQIENIEETIAQRISKSFQSGVLNDHSRIFNSRMAMYRNTLIQNNSLPDIINNKIVIRDEIFISAIITTMRKSHLKNTIIQMNNQERVTLELIVLTHGFSLTDDEKRDLESYSKFPIKFLTKDARVAYGNCLNFCIDEMSYDYFAKIDDDDEYYPNYLIDAWISLKYSKAELVGKHASFWYLESENLIAERFEVQQNKYTEFVAGATLFCSKETIDHYRFSPLTSRVDSDLLMRLRNDGKKLYCNHSYEFCVFRDKDTDAHTWKVRNIYILRSATVKFDGLPHDTLAVKNIDALNGGL